MVWGLLPAASCRAVWSWPENPYDQRTHHRGILRDLRQPRCPQGLLPTRLPLALHWSDLHLHKLADTELELVGFWCADRTPPGADRRPCCAMGIRELGHAFRPCILGRRLDLRSWGQLLRVGLSRMEHWRGHG